MYLLVEIAERAHVSVEGVIRVLTREPVSDAIKERVLAVLDELDAEQTRVLQRFALAALHDVLPRPHETALHVDGDVVRGPEYVDLPRALLPAGPEPAPEQLPAPPDTAHLVQLSAVLEELAGAVRDLRQETDTERRERVDDLAVLIELISTGWQGLDRRLGRLERQLARLESPRAAEAPPAAPAPPRTPPPPSEPPPAAIAPTLPPPAEPSPRSERDRLPLAAALALVGVVVGTLAVLQLVSGDAEIAGVVSAGGNGTLVETAEEEEPPAPTATAQRTTTQAATTQAATTRAVTTTRGITTPPVETTGRPSPPATTTAVLGTEAERPRPPTTTAAATTTAASSGFQPTRNWAWAPAPDADYYAVQFAREGATIYRTTTRAPRLTLPDSVEFRPGSYRWIVRPGFGSPSDARLGAPLVDSGFTVRS